MFFLLVIVGSLSAAMWVTLNAKYIRDGNHGASQWSSSFVLGGSMLAASLYVLALWLALWSFGYIEFPVSMVFWSALGLV